MSRVFYAPIVEVKNKCIGRSQGAKGYANATEVTREIRKKSTGAEAEKRIE